MKISDAKTFRDLVDKLKERGDKPVLMERRGGNFQKVTYAELHRNAKAISEYLHRLVINKGYRVAILSHSRLEWGQVYLGAVYGGRTVIPLDPQLNEEEIGNLMRVSEAKVLFTTEKFIPSIKKHFPNMPIFTLDDSGETKFSEILMRGMDFLEEGETQVDVSPDDIASIIFTSGTTGISKGVVLSHYNFLSDAILAEELLNLQEEDIFLSVLPIHHTFEFTADFLDPIVRGNTIVYARSLKSKELLEDLKDSKATMLLGVPLLFEKLYTGIMKKLKMESALKRFLINYGMKKGKRDAHRNNNVPVRNFVTNMLLEKAGLSSLRVMIAGGAALRPDVEEGIRTMGIGIVQGYGLSEASPIVTINPPDRPKVGSIGLPIPGIEVKIFEPDREGIGEIIVRGPIVMKGYYRNIEETRKTIVDGWLHTGDMGYKDNDGYFYITGRKKSLIVTPGGKNVFPEEIEYKLVSQDLISEALVYGVYNEEKQGEEIKAVIYPEYENIDCPEENTECYENMIKEVVREINDGSPNYKRITHVEIRRDEFIKTTTRKIKRYMYEKKE